MNFVKFVRQAAAFQNITVITEDFYAHAKIYRPGKATIDAALYTLNGETLTAVATIIDDEGCVEEVLSMHDVEIGNKAIREFFKQCQAI